MKFNVGARVYVKSEDGHCPRGKATLIKYEPHNFFQKFLVRFDEFDERLHNGNGKCEPGHGWYCTESELEILRDKFFYKSE